MFFAVLSYRKNLDLTWNCHSNKLVTNDSRRCSKTIRKGGGDGCGAKQTIRRKTRTSFFQMTFWDEPSALHSPPFMGKLSRFSHEIKENALPRIFQNPEKGAFARGALRKFVANCAPNICAKLTVFRFVHQKKDAQNCRKFVASISDNFMQIPLFQWPLLQISEYSIFVEYSGDIRGIFGPNVCVCGLSFASETMPCQ